MSKQQLSNIKYGTRHPYEPQLVRLAKAFGMTRDEFVALLIQNKREKG